MFARLPFRVLAAAVGLAAAWLVISTGHGVRSQALKTIRSVVPYAPGGVADIIARLIAEEIGRTSGATVVVENRPGAGGAVGTETVARAAADGNTLLVASTPFIIEPLLRKLNYDPLTSFEPLCYLVNAPTVIVVNSASKTALKDAAVKEKLGIQGLYPVGTCGADFAAYLKEQHDAYSRIVAEANIKAE
jgi:tripartite-type tricarboxylate transporter receptor subunit TctC